MINFTSLWINHPGSSSKPCDSRFVNQCAIRMGVAFRKSAVNLSSFNGANCKKSFPGLKHSTGHILRAEELANWMCNQTGYFGSVSVHRSGSSDKDFKNKKGIIFIKDGWSHGGDHIDLWDGSNMKAGENTWIALGRQVWFWELGGRNAGAGI